MNVLFFGLGRIGLPQSLVFAEAGHQVFGYDSDPGVVDNLLAGKLPFYEPQMTELLEGHLGGRFRPIHEWRDVLPEIDAVLFTLGTKAPNAETCLQENKGDISPIEKILTEILSHPGVQKELLLIFRTTLFLGSTERLKHFVEETLPVRESQDFFMAFVPERLIEGQAIREEQTLPKILSAFSPGGIKKVASLFKPVGGRQIIVSSPTTAEFCKLADNSYRNTIFAFSNELSMWSVRHKVDASEVIAAINADYDRNNIPRPGFVSGYCLGKDPYIFEYGFHNKGERDFQSLWYYGRRTNDHLIKFTVKHFLENLVTQGKPPSAAKIAVLGLSFKEDVDDFRMSHAFDLINALSESGIGHVVGFDPLVGHNKYTQIPEEYDKSRFSWTDTLAPELFVDVDGILIANRHEILRNQTTSSLSDLLAWAPRPLFIFDGWNIWRAAESLNGIIYQALGYEGTAA